MEILNVVIGALIALISSLLTTIILVSNQKKNDQNKRKWELHDLSYVEKKNIFYSRIIAIENWAIESARCVYLMGRLENKIKNGEIITDPTEDFEKSFFIEHIVGILSTYGDSESRQIFNDLLSCLLIISKRLNALQNNGIVSDDPNPYSQFTILYGKFLKKIDELKLDLVRNLVKIEDDIH